VGDSGNGSSQSSADMIALQSALASGDLTSAQKTISTIQQNVQSAKGHGYHHHKSSSDDRNTSTTSSAT